MPFGKLGRTAAAVALAAVLVATMGPVPSSAADGSETYSDVHASAVSWGPGRVDVFYRGTDATLRHSWTSDGVRYLDQSLGGSVAGEPQAAAPAAGRLEVFFRGTDGQLHQRVYSAGWYPDVTLEATDSEPSVVATSGRLDLFFGYAGTLRHSWRFATGPWQSENLGVAMSLNPAAVAGGPGGLSVMTVHEGGLYKTSYTSRGWQTSRVGHSGQPSAVALGAGRIGIAHWGGDGGVVARIYDPSTKWGDQVTLLSDGANGQPSSPQNDNGALLVFLARRVTTTTSVRHRLAAVTYSRERHPLPGVDVAGPPTAVTAGSRGFAVFVRGPGNALQVVSYSSQSGWLGTPQVISRYFAG